MQVFVQQDQMDDGVAWIVFRLINLITIKYIVIYYLITCYLFFIQMIIISCTILIFNDAVKVKMLTSGNFERKNLRKLFFFFTVF